MKVEEYVKQNPWLLENDLRELEHIIKVAKHMNIRLPANSQSEYLMLKDRDFLYHTNHNFGNDVVLNINDIATFILERKFGKCAKLNNRVYYRKSKFIVKGIVRKNGWTLLTLQRESDGLVLRNQIDQSQCKLIVRSDNSICKECNGLGYYVEINGNVYKPKEVMCESCGGVTK